VTAPLPAGAVPSDPLPPGAKRSSIPTGAQPEALPKGALSDNPPPKQTPSGLYSVNPGVNVVGDYLTRWTKFAAGGIRDEFRTIVDGLANTFHLGIYDFNQGHHYAPNDPHLDGRAMDVDTINGESVGTTLTPTIRSYIQKVLETPNTRVGVPSQIYRALPADIRARAFVDAPAHIHTELAKVMPDQTVAPPGFKPDPSQGFVKDPQAKPPRGAVQAPPPGAKPASLADASNPMDAPSGATSAGGTLPPMAHSVLAQVAGHQDLPFILANALQRDNAKLPSPRTIAEQWNDPNSNVYKAWHLYQHDPAQAMDEYGAGSPAQDRWLAQNRPDSPEGRTSALMLRVPALNALTTFGLEQVNPMAWAEGLGAGKVLGVASDAARALGLDRVAQGVAKTVGLGSPLYDLNRRGGAEASQWAKGAISSINAPNELLHMPTNKQVLTDVFGGLTPQAQSEVVRLKQGLKPDPAFEADHADLERRAKILADDMAKVEHHQDRVGVLPPERKFDKAGGGQKYFPMSNSYDFGPQHELEQELMGPGTPGAGGPSSQRKGFETLDQAVASGKLDENFLPANNYDTWRRQRLQRVAFEDAIARAPASVRRDITVADFHNTMGIPPQEHWQPSFHGMERWGVPEEPDRFEKIDRAFSDFNARLVGDGADVKTQRLADELGYKPQFGDSRRITPAGSPEWVSAINLMGGAKSPVLARSMVAPELWDFMRGNKGLQRFVSTTGSYLPGQEQTFVGKYVAMMRNAIISNFVFHPAVNVAGNDAVARGIYNLGGPQWSVGGYGYNAAKSLATQFGLKNPESWIGTAQEYSHWLDRALVAGGTAEFGEPRGSALGGEYARVVTTPAEAGKAGTDIPRMWIQRADKALTKAGDFNRERTFGQKGEQVFAVSLFRDAVQKGGLSDAKAGELVREALGDYYNFDPKSPWSTFFFFMPWLKGNMKFWVNTLVRHPQYVTGVSHALRNFGLEQSPESYQGPYPTGDFTTYGKGGVPYTPPFPGRDIGHIAQAAGSLASGDALGAAEPMEQMLAGRATPPTRLVTDTLSTINAAFSGDVKGPETDWNVIVNPRAPVEEQRKQAAAYFASHFIPVPLFAYAVQDAARKGMSGADLGQALVTASGGGYFGQAKMDDYTKRQLKKAQAKYKTAYDNYRYKDFGADYLRSEWDTYTDRLRSLGVIQ